MLFNTDITFLSLFTTGWSYFELGDINIEKENTSTPWKFHTKSTNQRILYKEPVWLILYQAWGSR